MNRSTTRSCICSVLEKQIARRINRLIRCPQVNVFALDFLHLVLAKRIGKINALFKHRADTGQPVMSPVCRVPHTGRKALGARRRGDRQLGADLLVLSRNSTSDPAGGAGSYALRCVRHGSRDVLLVREAHEGPYRRIAACVDFSSTSDRAAERAAAFANRDGATLDLLHAFVPPWDVVPFAAMPVTASTTFQTDYISMLQNRLDGLKDALLAKCPGLKISQQIEPAGSAGSALVDVMQRIDTDLAVLGSHGRGRLERMLLGSTAERVIRNAHCSVLTVR